VISNLPEAKKLIGDDFKSGISKLKSISVLPCLSLNGHVQSIPIAANCFGHLFGLRILTRVNNWQISS
jgi:hypothetical protein